MKTETVFSVIRTVFAWLVFDTCINKIGFDSKHVLKMNIFYIQIVHCFRICENKAKALWVIVVSVLSYEATNSVRRHIPTSLTPRLCGCRFYSTSDCISLPSWCSSCSITGWQNAALLMNYLPNNRLHPQNYLKVLFLIFGQKQITTATFPRERSRNRKSSYK